MSLPTTLTVPSGDFALRRATEADLPAIIGLLTDDPLGAARDDPSRLAPYRAAFTAIDADRSQLLVVAFSPAQALVGVFQLTFIPGLSRGGATRVQIESVRVHTDQRGGGLGAAMMRWAVAEASARGCALVQLTSDRSRADAHRFYRRLGFVDSHLGYKLAVTPR
ncbi:GNAT family N-acetyltransferase [Pilimelia columellifera]